AGAITVGSPLQLTSAAGSIFLTSTDFVLAPAGAGPGGTVTTTGTGAIEVSPPSGTITLGGPAGGFAGILNNAELDLFRPASGLLRVGSTTNSAPINIQLVGDVTLPVTAGRPAPRCPSTATTRHAASP